MITEAPASSPRVWGPPAVLAGLSTVTMLGGQPLTRALAYDRAGLAAGQWWRLLSCNFVHLGWWHLVLNQASLALLVLLCPEPVPALAWVRRVLVLGVGMSLGLYYLTPEVQTYVGMSGMIYGLFALGLGRQALRRDEIAIACLLFLLARVGWELKFGPTASEVRLVGGGIVAESHLYGIASAAIYMGLAYLGKQIRERFFARTGDA